MRLLHKMPEARPVSAEVVVEELRRIERELLVGRRKAGQLAATPQMDIVGPASQSPREPVVAMSPPQSASTPRSRRRMLGVAAVLAALAAIALVCVLFVPARKSKVTIVAVGPTSATAHDQEPLATILTPQKRAGQTAQPAASPDPLGSRTDRRAVSGPSPGRGFEVSRSQAATKTAPSHAPDVSQHGDGPAGHIAPSAKKMRNELPHASIADDGPAPRDGPGRREGGSLGAMRSTPMAIVGLS